MSDTKLISYITSDFQTKSDMKVGEIEWEKIMNKNFEKFMESQQILKHLLKVNYFKKTLLMLFKFMFFREICYKFIIYSKISPNKTEYNKNLIRYNFIYPNKLNFLLQSYK